jgi:hypothetical protein
MKTKPTMKISTQIFTTLFLFFLGMSNLAAKEVAQITGKVKDQKGEVLPFVNVALVEAGKGTLLTGSVTDEEGIFLIESSRSGKVQLVISSIGFETFTSDEFEIKPGVC